MPRAIAAPVRKLRGNGGTADSGRCRRHRTPGGLSRSRNGAAAACRTAGRTLRRTFAPSRRLRRHARPGASLRRNDGRLRGGVTADSSTRLFDYAAARARGFRPARFYGNGSAAALDARSRSDDAPREGARGPGHNPRTAALVVEPNADDDRSAAREDDAVLSRPLHVARDADVSVEHLHSELAVPPLRPGKSARPRARSLQRRCDAHLSQRRAKRCGTPQRELRARADGTLYA